MFTATVEGADQLASTWQRVVSTVRVGAERATGIGAKEGAGEARTHHQFRNRTGDLERSIQSRTIGWAGDTYKAEITAKMKYASYVEEGRGPVVAKPGSMLRLVIGGRVFFRKSVKAAAARPFMGLAYTKCEAVMLRELEVGIANAQTILDR